MVVSCAVFGCLNSRRYDKNRSFFHFPREESRCRQWVQAADRPELMKKGTKNLNKYHFICDLHFRTSDRLLKKLRRNAVPTLLLPNSDNAHSSKSTQTEFLHVLHIGEITKPLCAPQTTQISSTNSPLKRRLLDETQTECMKKVRLAHDITFASTHNISSNISPQLRKFIDVQSKLNANSRGNRYVNEFKFFVLSIYFASPLAYRVLGKTLRLPSERTLRSININMGTKVSIDLLSCLESKIKSMEESEKYCSICADEIPLKSFLYYQINTDKIIGFHEIDGVLTTEPATRAFVVMARGIFSNWKQPLGYCFLARTKNYEGLNTWLDNVISSILTIGFYVVAFVSDQASIFFNLAKERNVSIEKPYFFINEKKIFYIYDVPHLMISVRNNFMKYDFEFNDVDGTKLLAKWKSIETFYRVDSKRAYRLAPKLTESHINPNNFEKLKIKFASDVFSKAVAAAMHSSIEFGQLEDINLGTVKFIELMNKTFDILNSSSASDSNVYEITFSAKSYEIETLHRFLQFLSQVIVRGKEHSQSVTNSIKCLEGLKITIKSIVGLSEDLRSKDFPFLNTLRLNLDPMDTFFSHVREQAGNCRRPTPIQFSKTFKKLFMLNLLNHPENGKCSDDSDILLMNTASLNKIIDNFPNPENPIIQVNKSSAVLVATVDYRFDLPKTNAFNFICGYLLKKCYNIHKCDGISSYIQAAKNDDNNESRGKCVDKTDLLLINPPGTFIALIKTLDERFKIFFQNKIVDCIGSEILKNMQDINYDCCCPCFPNEYLKKLFVRLSIFNMLRFNNKMFKDKALTSRRFGVNLII